MRGAAVLLALTLLAGSAGASWMAMGGTEPSTSYDVGSLWMFAEPDTGQDRPAVYFQAFQSVEGTSVNPNVAIVESRMLAPGAVHHRALLGIWKDCNEDGYVGHAESALLDYHAVVPHNRSTCPLGSPFSDGIWVSEMIGIGMVDPCEIPDPEHTIECGATDDFHENERAFYAPGTMVWGDVGAPGDVPVAECPLAPLPPATTSTSGLLLAYADCQIDRRVATAVNEADRDGTLGLRFEDPAHPEDSTSLLNRPFPVTLFGGAQGPGLLGSGSGERAASVWDCTSPRELGAADPTGLLDEIVLRDETGRLTGPQPTLPIVGVITLFEDHDGDDETPGERRVPLSDHGLLVWAPRPAPALHQPTGSWWDTLEHAADGPRSDCDDASVAHAASPGPIVEGGAPQLDAGRKDRASLAFTWYDGHRGLNGNIDGPLGTTTAPSDAGLTLFRHGRGGVGPLWSADAPSANEPQLVSRGTLERTTAKYWTYYAKLGERAQPPRFLIPSGGSAGLYAKEACGSMTSGVHNGWVCDGSLWWLDALGRDVRPRYLDGTPYGPIPGERYHLVDVDCYDGHVVAGSYASLAATVPEGTCR